MRFLKKAAPFLFIAAVAALLLYIPDIGPERYTDLGTFFKIELRRQSYAGYAVAVVADGSVLYVDALGSDGSGKPLSIDTPLLLGSVSKTFTGLLTLSLERDKMVGIDDPVRLYLPWLVYGPPRKIDPNSAGGAGTEVTLRHLISQTSGVSDLSFDDTHAHAANLESAVRSLSNATPDRPPGVEMHYINTGYQAVALALEKAAGQSFSDMVITRIFRPLGMDRSSASPAKVAGALPMGSGSFFGAPLPRRQTVLPFGASSGYMVSTANDMARYLAYLAGPEKLARTPVPARFIRPLYEPLVDVSPYAYGWRISGSGLDLEASHSGSLDGSSAFIALWPARRAGVVILAPQNSLLQSLMAMPALVNGARSLVLNGSSDRPFPLGRIYILLAVIAVVHILALALQTGGALAWARDIRCRVEAVGSRGPLRAAAALASIGIALRLAIFVFAPIVLGAGFERRFTWATAFALEPGLAGWAVAALSFGILRNIARLAWIGGPR
jgi:CubicO group peptidase (beta-lactamase class C family)